MTWIHVHQPHPVPLNDQGEIDAARLDRIARQRERELDRENNIRAVFVHQMRLAGLEADERWTRRMAGLMSRLVFRWESWRIDRIRRKRQRILAKMARCGRSGGDEE